jgi:Polysulphide reductase, NrfD
VAPVSRVGQTLRRRGRHAVTREGVQGVRPDREAVTGAAAGRRQTGRRGGRRGEQLMVPPPEFTSYYGKPVINSPVWASPDIPGYLFLGGLAGGSALLGAGAQLTGRPALATAAKAGAFGAGCVSVAALIHDLGKPARFLNMMRVFKVTSPMSVGSWLLGGFVPAAGVAAASALTGRLPRIGAAATAGSALLGPAVAAYTAALISDTAVPAWHDGYREMPFVFTGSAAMAAGGLGLLAAPVRESAPARNLALAGLALEASAFERMKHRIGMVGEPYDTGRGGGYIKAGQVLSVLGVAGALLGRRSRVVSAASGAAFLAASAATRFGIFHAGLASAEDPKYTVVPQRERVRAREREARREEPEQATARPAG